MNLAPPDRVPAAPSIRRRLSRAVWVGSLVCAAAVSVGVWLATEEEVDELLDDTLQASAAVLGPLLREQRADPAHAAEVPGSSRFAWQVVDASQQVLARSSRAPEIALAATATAGFFDAPGWRVYGTTLGGDGRTLYVAQTRVERAEAQFEVAMNSVLAALAVSLLGYFWLRSRLRHELVPLQRLSQRLLEHEPLAPGATLGPAERSELQPVHSAIDQLGQRLSKRLAQERAFTAHAAHALRTPLAGIDAQLAVSLRECPEALRPRLQRAREAAGRLQRVVAALLTLFRSDGDIERQAVDLDRLLRQFPLERVQVEVDAALPLQADVDLLAAALANLLDNAQRHGASHIQVSTPAPHTLRLDDDGPGISAEHRQALTSALDAQAYDVVPGLGLTLADLVARAHGGRLRLVDPAQGRGFAVELALAPTH